MTTVRLEIITPEKTFFDGNTEQIIARTTVGDVGILNGHEPYCAALGIGQMRVMIDGKFRRAATSGGIIKVSKEKTVILVQSCEWAEDIDVARAEHAKIAGRLRRAITSSALQRRSSSAHSIVLTLHISSNYNKKGAKAPF